MLRAPFPLPPLSLLLPLLFMSLVRRTVAGTIRLLLLRATVISKVDLVHGCGKSASRPAATWICSAVTRSWSLTEASSAVLGISTAGGALMLGVLILTGDGGNLPFQYQVF